MASFLNALKPLKLLPKKQYVMSGDKPNNRSIVCHCLQRITRWIMYSISRTQHPLHFQTALAGQWGWPLCEPANISSRLPCFCLAESPLVALVINHNANQASYIPSISSSASSCWISSSWHFTDVRDVQRCHRTKQSRKTSYLMKTFTNQTNHTECTYWKYISFLFVYNRPQSSAWMVQTPPVQDNEPK